MEDMDNGIRRLKRCEGWPRPVPCTASACTYSTAPRRNRPRNAINGIIPVGGNTFRLVQAKASPVQ